MAELKAATKEVNWFIVLISTLRLECHPLTRKSIGIKLKEQGLNCNDNKLGVIINQAILKDGIVKMKYPRYYSFYGLPEWQNPQTKDFKKELGFNKITVKFANPPKL